MSKKLGIALALLLCIGGFFKTYFSATVACSYPHFQQNPSLDDRMKRFIAPHLLPLEHPLKELLDSIFSQSKVLQNEQSLLDAHFSIIASMPGSFVTVARHPSVPGYVFKLYLDSEIRTKEEIANSEWLAKRCIGAEKIRKVIKAKNLRYFTVPDKWIYILPTPHTVPILVVETDMELESIEMTEYAWKTYITSDHLDELYEILKHGYGTVGLVRNIPYTKHGTFAFTDTEYPTRPLKLKRAKPYLSEEMQIYWSKLIR